jgi:hypothetical protein
VGDLKPTRNQAGAGVGVAVGGIGRVPQVWLQADFCQTRPVAIPTATEHWYGSGGRTLSLSLAFLVTIDFTFHHSPYLKN